MVSALRSESVEEGYPRATRILDTSAGGIRETLEAHSDHASKVRDDLGANLLVIDGAVFKRSPEPTLSIVVSDNTVHLRVLQETSDKVASRRRREPNKNEFHQPWLDFSLHELDYARIVAEKLASRLGAKPAVTPPNSRLDISGDFLMSDGPFGCGASLQMIRRARGLVEASSHVIGTMSDDVVASYVALRGLLSQAAPDEAPSTARALGHEGERRLSGEIRQFCAAIAREPVRGRSWAEPLIRTAAAVCEIREQMFGPDLDPELADLIA